MPNRKTFDPREKYDHSGRPVEHAQKNDLKPDVSEEASREDTPGVASRSRRETGNRAEKPPAGR